jgi:hypothetical protein
LKILFDFTLPYAVLFQPFQVIIPSGATCSQAAKLVDFICRAPFSPAFVKMD